MLDATTVIIVNVLIFNPAQFQVFTYVLSALNSVVQVLTLLLLIIILYIMNCSDVPLCIKMLIYLERT